MHFFVVPYSLRGKHRTDARELSSPSAYGKEFLGNASVREMQYWLSVVERAGPQAPPTSVERLRHTRLKRTYLLDDAVRQHFAFVIDATRLRAVQ